MAALSDYTENKLIDFLLRGRPFAKPTALYMALFNAGQEGGGGVELSGGGYARAAVSVGLTAWSATDGPTSTTVSTGQSGKSYLLQSVAFPRVTSSLGAVTHAGFFDAATGGNLLFWGGFQTPFTLAAGLQVRFPAGSVSLSISEDVDGGMLAPNGSLMLDSSAILLADGYVVYA